MSNSALTSLSPLCTTTTSQSLHAHLQGISASLYSSPLAAQKALSALFTWAIQLPHSTFRSLLASPEQPNALLITHWLALTALIAGEYVAARWLRRANWGVEEAWRGYNEWPVWVQRYIESDKVGGDLDLQERDG